MGEKDQVSEDKHLFRNFLAHGMREKDQVTQKRAGFIYQNYRNRIREGVQQVLSQRGLFIKTTGTEFIY